MSGMQKRFQSWLGSFTGGFGRYLNDAALFPVWYFVYTWGFWVRYVPRTFLMIYDGLGLESVLGNLLAPFRRDRTFAGYFVGIFVRAVWTIGSVFALTILGLVMLTVVALFYSAPFLLAVINPFPAYNARAGIEIVPKIITSFEPRLIYLLPYFAIWFLVYLIIKNREKYYQNIKEGRLTKSLRKTLWRRMEFDAKVVDPIYLSSKKDFLMFLRKRKLNEEDFLSAKKWVLDREYEKTSWQYWKDEFFYRKPGVNVGWVSGFLPELKHFSVDLTKEAAKNDLPEVFGRERELEQILTILGRPTRNNVLIVGESGVGKTSLVYSIAWLILGVRQNVDLPTADSLISPLKGRRVIELNTGGMVGRDSRGSLEATFNKALRELSAGDTLLFVNQVENLIQAGLVGYLTPIVRSTRFPIIASTTPQIYNSQLRNLQEFVSEFEVIRITPPGIVEAIRILEGIASEIEEKRPVFFTYPALHAAVELSERYIHESVLPEKAEKVLLKSVELSSRGIISAENVEQAVATISGVPVGELSREEADKLLNLEQLLKARIVGQDEAIRTIAKALRRARTGVSSQNRPIASLMFLGSTGVGKTLTAKTLAQVYFTPETVVSVSEAQLNQMVEKSFIRYDMSEFSEYGAVTGFIKRITGEVRQKPFSLVLLDEFEKAEPAIHNLFLQIIEDGRLSSGEGEVVDFRSSIIIATSNAVTGVPQDTADVEAYIRGQLQDHFRPELINRFDGLVMFNVIGKTEIIRIVDLELNKLAKRLKADQEIAITWTPALSQELARLGYDPEFGARPLRRVIQDRLEDSLAQKILRKQLQFGDSYQLDVRDLQS
ncbi:ATP-dependent Clp protease ATP-binding subunit [candidate division WWE3 bacterium]|uniref:ATP-dependent Clp protease ATP-binding subunit n=1 Tax=candidate division WWE3 bacterium TaxID=2053526 RepID=A0A955LK92_UNCKA|nr:ATP-dependent Clp protease ATP-binding subunit [candidate division WWE3 bacterium]